MKQPTDLQLARLRFTRAKEMYLAEVRKAEAFVLRTQYLRASAGKPALLKPQA